MNILVCNAQVPFVRGGAEEQADGLVATLRAHGHRAELVTAPFRWNPVSQILASAMVWRLLDLSEANGIPIDRIITMSFPSYATRHVYKIVWLVHLLRQAYDWYGTPRTGFTAAPEDRRVRARLLELDRRTLSEAQGFFTTSKNNAARVKRYLGLDAELLYAPPRLTGRFRSNELEDYILSVGRLDETKRTDLLIRALARVPQARAIIAGEGREAAALAKLAHTLGVSDRVQFCGRVDDDTLIDLYARARAVFFGPVDEDYGYIAVEAFMAARPVITLEDSGGALEFVQQNVTGLITMPEANAIAQAIAQMYAEPTRARAWGEAGRARVGSITWERVVERFTT